MAAVTVSSGPSASGPAQHARNEAWRRYGEQWAAPSDSIVANSPFRPRIAGWPAAGA